MAHKGLVLVNTGTGKGKTTASLGTLIRALGQGHKAAFIQFIKSAPSGESKFLENYAKEHPDMLDYARIGLGFLKDEPSEGDRQRALDGLELAKKLSHDKDLIVLDEVNIAMDKGLLPIPDMVAFIEGRPEKLSLILTGRGCPPEIVALANTVTEMTEIKHAYHQGIPAKKGIDF
ncbi:MAG: cob(I)yrinic acid a,c-diamide adenosyltransferase [Deltaproteobacteria bacterium]|jgi:cob(I)alamin adenosyltransferase|nr:cob(I)yrinic acid a,c-diamide adenosyltransferase [Deltaproteobacteria bacterium]